MVKKLEAIKVNQVRSSCETWLSGDRQRNRKNTWSKKITNCADFVSWCHLQNKNYANIISICTNACQKQAINWQLNISILKLQGRWKGRKLSISHDPFFFAATLLLCRKHILYIRKVKQINQTALPHSHIMN